jgi:hypothetical protein
MTGRGIAVLGLVLFAVSWFVEAHDALGIADDLSELVGAVGQVGAETGLERPPPPDIRRGPPGWRAARAAWDLLGDDDATRSEGTFRTTWLGLTPLTNVAMLVAAALLFARRSLRACAVLLFACAAMNAGWLVLTDAKLRDGLGAGYFLWLGSFVVTGVGALRAAGEA